MTERGIFNPGPFYQRPRFIRNAIIVVLIAAYVILFRSELNRLWYLIWEPETMSPADAIQTILILLWNGFLFLASFLLTFMLVSQYILPVQTNEQRKKVFERLFAYLTRQHGPAVFIRAGKEIAKKSELLSSLPGVAFIDLTSAIALEKQSPPRIQAASKRSNQASNISTSTSSQNIIFKSSNQSGKKDTAVRIAGPGITFTESGEIIRGVIDLRPQIRTRRGVNAYTREGIEIQTSITTMFTIGQIPETLNVVYEGDETPENLRIVILGEKIIRRDGDVRTSSQQFIKELVDGLDDADKKEIHRYIEEYRRTGGQVRYQTSLPKVDPAAPFLFDPERIFKAIYASSLDVREDNHKEWTDLPPFIATEIFRNMIAGEYYDNFYFLADQFQKLKTNFALKIRHQGVLAFKFFERKDNIPFKAGQDWLEDHYNAYPVQELLNPKVLRARGIKVIHASFSDLKPVNPSVRQQLLDNWSAYWENEAEYTRVEHELVRTRIINKARIQAQINLKDQLLKLLGSSTLADDALALRMLQALEAVAADPKTRQFMPADTIHMLRSIWEWLWTEDQSSQIPSGISDSILPGVNVKPGGGDESDEIFEVMGMENSPSIDDLDSKNESFDADDEEDQENL